MCPSSLLRALRSVLACIHKLIRIDIGKYIPTMRDVMLYVVAVLLCWTQPGPFIEYGHAE